MTQAVIISTACTGLAKPWKGTVNMLTWFDIARQSATRAGVSVGKTGITINLCHQAITTVSHVMRCRESDVLTAGKLDCLVNMVCNN